MSTCKKFLIFVVPVVMLLGSAAAGPELAERQVLRYGSQYADVTNLDPHFGSMADDVGMIMSMFNGLVRLPEGSIDIEKIEPDLATKWEISPDYTRVTFHLRKGVQFHKGFGEMTAEDVKFSIERVQNPKSGSPFKVQFASLKEVKVIDNYTLKVSFTGPDPFLLLKFMNYNGGFIVSRKAVEKYGKDFRLNLVGTGPFELKEYLPREKVVLTRNEKYFRGKPVLERVEVFFMADISSRLMAFEKKDIDSMRINDQYIPQLKAKGAKIDLAAPGEYSVLFLNPTKKPLEDIRVRKALAHGTDRNALYNFMKDVALGPAYSSCPDGYFGYTADVPGYEYNTAKAQKLLAEAGFRNGLILKMSMTSSETMTNTMNIIQEQWRKIGVNLEMNIVDHSTYHSLIRKDANPVVLYNTTRIPTCDVYMTAFFHSDSIVGKPTAVTNFSHYNSIDDLLNQARVEVNKEKQKKMYAEAQKKVMADCIIIPLVIRPQFNGVRRANVDIGYSTKETLATSYFYNEKTRILKP